MPLTPATAEIPLTTDTHGVVRVGATRVTLDSVVGAFRAGATPEEIAQQFPVLVLADVYQVIAYYLNRTAEVEAYLAPRRKEAESLQSEIESRFDPRGMRARHLACRTAKASRAMLRLLADANLNHDLIRGVLRRKSSLDLVRVLGCGASRGG